MTFIPRTLQARTATVLALAFFIFLSFFLGTTYVSFRSSLVDRSDSEAHSQLAQIAAAVKPGISKDTLAQIFSEHRSIGESPLHFTLFQRQNNSYTATIATPGSSIPDDVKAKIALHPGEPIPYSVPKGNMRAISISESGLIIAATYNTLLLDEAEESILQVFAYYLAGGLLAGVLGGMFLSKYLIGPISSLAQAARTILYPSEKTPARLPVSQTIEEVAALARSINALLEAREQALERQRNFAADAAHELRTPLTVLKGEIEVELRMTDSKSPHVELLQSNLEEIDRLISTVQDLLELAEIEAADDRNNTPRSECSILSAIHYAADRLKPIAAARKLAIIVPDADIIIMAQEQRITRLIYNLLLNAVQHSADASQVDILLRRSKGGCLLEISDRGKGIPPERLTHLFERFHHTTHRSVEKRGGAGLGLSIVKSIADHYGFALSVQSALNMGTTITVSIPQTAIL